MIGQKIMNWATFSCKEASEMIEKQAVTKLSSAEKIKLSMHTAMCETCKAYARESELIDKSILNHIKAQAEEKNNLSDEIKTNLIRKLEDKSE